MRLFVSIFLLLISLSSPAGTPWQEGAVFKPATNSRVIWSATNNLPSEVWIYKVVPEAFSMAVISNAMKFGDFKMANKVKANTSLLPDKQLIQFHNQNEYGRLRMLTIAPSLGVIEFQSEVDMKAPWANVPSEDEAERMGRQILFLLGVDRSLLSERVTKGYDETRTRYSPDRKTKIGPLVSQRGVAFERRVDGLRLSDAWCFLIHFGNEGRITDFSFIWRNVIPHSSHAVVSPEEILAMIKSGRAKFPEQPMDVGEMTKAEKLEVVKVTSRYDNGRKSEPLDFMYPFADMEISADFGTNKATFYLFCPLVK